MFDPALALKLSGTIRHDGSGGVTDDLPEPAALEHWAAKLGFAVTAELALFEEVLQLRRAVRSMFAHTVAPRPLNPADSGHLVSRADATEQLNNAAARAPIMLQLNESGESVHTSLNRDSGDRLLTALATAGIALLTSPDRDRLRSCPAPRCCRYFLAERANQEWCKSSCGNRARVARHHRRRAASMPMNRLKHDQSTPDDVESSHG